jgi:hypothetical protein
VNDIKIAKVFDTHDANGMATIGPNRRKLADQVERARVVEYLENGQPVLTTRGRDADRLAPHLGKIVPLSFHTDGTWVWSLALAYYVGTYGYAPEPELLHHIRARDYLIPQEVSQDRIKAAGAAVLGK